MTPLKVGDVVTFYSQGGHPHAYGQGVVTKLGRRWATIDTDGRGRSVQADINDGWVKPPTGYPSWVSVFTAEGWSEHKDQQVAIAALSERINRNPNWHSNLTADQARRVLAILQEGT